MKEAVQELSLSAREYTNYHLPHENLPAEGPRGSKSPKSSSSTFGLALGVLDGTAAGLFNIFDELDGEESFFL